MRETLSNLVESYGYVAVFVLIALESLGIPLPGESALVSAAAFAASGRLSLPRVLFVAAAAAIVGDNGGCWIGRKGGFLIIKRYGDVLHIDESSAHARFSSGMEQKRFSSAVLLRFLGPGLHCWPGLGKCATHVHVVQRLRWHYLGSHLRRTWIYIRAQSPEAGALRWTSYSGIRTSRSTRRGAVPRRPLVSHKRFPLIYPDRKRCGTTSLVTDVAAASSASSSGMGIPCPTLRAR
jgi:membrane protein YqaA with SNARE-associated domain